MTSNNNKLLISLKDLDCILKFSLMRQNEIQLKYKFCCVDRTCIIFLDCGDPAPNNGKSNVTVFTYGTIAKIECEPGFNIPGDSVITCQSDGTWSDSLVCNTSGECLMCQFSV
jgi:hypothetical protein